MSPISNEEYFKLANEVGAEDERKRKSIEEKVRTLRNLSFMDITALHSKYKEEEKKAYTQQLRGPKKLEYYLEMAEWREACEIVIKSPELVRHKEQHEKIVPTRCKKENQILQAYLCAVIQSGEPKVTLDDLAKMTGIPRSTVHHYMNKILFLTRLCKEIKKKNNLSRTDEKRNLWSEAYSFVDQLMIRLKEKMARSHEVPDEEIDQRAPIDDVFDRKKKQNNLEY